MKLPAPPSSSDIDSKVTTLSFIDCAKSGFIKSVIASAAPATVLPAPKNPRPIPIPIIARPNAPPSFNNSALPPTASDIDNKVMTLSFIDCAKSALPKLVKASDNPAIPAPAPKNPRPIPIPIIDKVNAPPSFRNSSLPPTSSEIESKIFTFSLIFSAQDLFPIALFKESDNPAMALPAPNTPRPIPIPDIVRKNVPPFTKKSAAPPTSS